MSAYSKAVVVVVGKQQIGDFLPFELTEKDDINTVNMIICCDICLICCAKLYDKKSTKTLWAHHYRAKAVIPRHSFYFILFICSRIYLSTIKILGCHVSRTNVNLFQYVQNFDNKL